MKLRISLILLIFSTWATPAVAQHHPPHYAPIPYLQNSQLGDRGVYSQTPEQKQALEKQEEKERLEACERMKNSNGVPFSYWAHRHDEAHCKGWIKQLLKATGSSCCSGPKSGECRISAINNITKEALVDDMWCPYGNAASATIDGMDGGAALICAGVVTLEMRAKKTCPTVHCRGAANGG